MSLKYPRPSDAAVELLRAPTRLLALVVLLLLPLPPEANPCVEEALEEEPLELEPTESTSSYDHPRSKIFNAFHTTTI